jgi:hypothetical protein
VKEAGDEATTWKPSKSVSMNDMEEVNSPGGGHTDVSSTKVDGFLGGVSLHDGEMCVWLRGNGGGNGEEIGNPILGES